MRGLIIRPLSPPNTPYRCTLVFIYSKRLAGECAQGGRVLLRALVRLGRAKAPTIPTCFIPQCGQSSTDHNEKVGDKGCGLKYLPKATDVYVANASTAEQGHAVNCVFFLYEIVKEQRASTVPVFSKYQAATQTLQPLEIQR